MLDLPDVTLLACGTTRHEELEYALRETTKLARFRNVVIVSDRFMSTGASMAHHIIPQSPFSQKEDWCVWFCTKMPKLMLGLPIASHVLSIQWDGFVLNPESWDDRNLDEHYIGAKWPDGVQGGTGMCLMSKAFLECMIELDLPATYEACAPADAMLCRDEYEGRPGWRSAIERMGIQFASLEVADRFCVENEPYVDSFGFHGEVSMASAREQGLI